MPLIGTDNQKHQKSVTFHNLSQVIEKMNDQEAFAIAVEEAKIGYKEGGVPVSFPSTSQLSECST